MTSKTRKPSAAKIIIVIARYFIKRNGYVCYSLRPTKGNEPYCVTIIGGKATGCTCPSRSTFKKNVACKHMIHCEALEAARPVATPVVTVGEAMAQANEQMAAHIDAVAAENDKAYTNDYDLLAPTKKPVSQAAYGSCGHLVKVGHEGHLCGGCYEKMFG